MEQLEPFGDVTAGDGRRALVRNALSEARVADIGAADEFGAFPTSLLQSIIGENILIVPDTNVLRSDMDRAVRTEARGVLMAAANAGAFRLFCAEHVLREVERQLPEWANYQGLSTDKYVSAWNSDYLPNLRVVRGDGIPQSVLSPAERIRIDSLPEPREDAASIRLSLVLGAVYLTMDLKAWEAAYGRPAKSEDLRSWLSVLFEGHEAAQLARFCHTSSWLAAAGVLGAVSLAATLIRKSPWSLAIILATGAAASLTLPREKRTNILATLARFRTKIAKGIVAIGTEFFLPYYELSERFAGRVPATPTWKELEQTNSRDDVLTRALVYNLARSSTGPQTALDLSKGLNQLTIGKSPQRIRELLRRYPNCFAMPYRGRWQVGHAYSQHPESEP